MNAESLKISIHENCRWSGPERFHIRARVTAADVQPFIDQAILCAVDDDDWGYIDRSATFLFNGSLFSIVDGEYDTRDEGGFVYFSASCADLTVQADFTPFHGGWNIDFSVDKDFGALENLDHTRWSNEATGLPPCFWIEPASMLRAILGTGRN